MDQEAKYGVLIDRNRRELSGLNSAVGGLNIAKAKLNIATNQLNATQEKSQDIINRLGTSTERTTQETKDLTEVVEDESRVRSGLGDIIRDNIKAIDEILNKTGQLTDADYEHIRMLQDLNVEMERALALRRKLAGAMATTAREDAQAEATVAPVDIGTMHTSLALLGRFPDHMERTVDAGSNLSKVLSKLSKDSVELGQALQSVVTSAIIDFGNTLGDLFSGDAGAGSFFDKILKVALDFAEQFGKIMIALGIAKAAISFSVNPITTIAAGVALIALSKAAKSMLDKGPGGVPKYHTGGVVPGSGEKLAMVQGGEGIFTPRQMQALGSQKTRAIIKIRNIIPMDSRIVWEANRAYEVML